VYYFTASCGWARLYFMAFFCEKFHVARLGV
jgi:hypothetical protein